jgi:hypothetical protein
MDTATASLLRQARIESVTVPAGDRGEQLVANLILSVIASRLHSDATAKIFIAQAHALALSLADQTLTYRPPQASKFAQVMCRVGGETETILLSIINDMLVVPEISPLAVANDHLGVVTPIVDVVSVKIVYLMLRLRTRRTAAALESMKTMSSSEQLDVAARRILTECIRGKIMSAEPLDRASDGLILAHNCVGKRNLPLAALALRHVDDALDQHMKTTAIKTHPAVVRAMKDQIKCMLGEIRHTGM